MGFMSKNKVKYYKLNASEFFADPQSQIEAF
jgi:hypothetical protein